MRWLKYAFLICLLPAPLLAEIPSTFTVSATPTIDTNAYSSGDDVGGLLTLQHAARDGVGSGIVHSVVIADLAQQSADYDIVFFSSNPSATTFTNNAALDIADDDLAKVVCVVQVISHATFADSGESFAHGTDCVFALGPSSSTLYAALVVRDTPTYTSASDLTVRVSILQD